MANGDKPPGAVDVQVISPAGTSNIHITCHDVDQANLIAGEVVEAVSKVQKHYEEK